MYCPDCNGEVAVFEVPEEYREHLPKPVPAAGLCTRCLTLHPGEEGEADPAAFEGYEPWPDAPDAAVPLAIAVGLLDSLALNRASIERLFERAVEAGADPFLTLERLESSGAVQPRVDLVARRRQLEQLLGYEPEQPEPEPEPGAADADTAADQGPGDGETEFPTE
jgi:hypothetical protein